MRRTVLAFSVVLAAASTACSSKDSSSAVRTPTVDGPGASDQQVAANETWADGKIISGPIVIETGITVTIAAGAHIRVVDSATITVKGTLKSGGANAQIVPSGKTWGGLIVAQGGTLALTGVSLEGADVAIDTQGGAKAASFEAGSITNAHVPFQVEASSKLLLTGAKVVAPTGTSLVEGDLVASRLDYDSNGNDGIQTTSDDATLSIEDSTLHGARGSSDMIASYDGAAMIHVSYTTISSVHCAFHLLRVTNLDISNVTSEGNIYGFMLHGSAEGGTKTVKNMNIIGSIEWGVHETDDAQNAAISFTGTYFNGNRNGDLYLKTDSVISVADNATARNAAAQPR